MYIKSYISKNQHVFGDYQINFESDGTLLSPDIVQKMEVSEIVTAKDERHANHYSFIIGENGSGKTSLLKSIIIGLLNKYTDNNWTEIRKGGLGYSKYVGRNFTHMHEYQKSSVGLNAIILWANYRFLSTEKGLEYMYFENRMGQAGSKVPLLRMLKSYNEKLNELNYYLRNKECTWRIEIEYFPQPQYEYGDGGQMIEINPNLQPLYSAFTTLITNESKGINQNLGDEYGQFLYNVTSNPYFPTRVDPKNPRQHFIEIAESGIYKKLQELAPVFKRGSSNDRIYNGREHSSYYIDHDAISSIHEPELWILPLLADMGLVRYEIFLDDVPLNELSSGEQMIIQLFCNLAPICAKLGTNNSYLILCDEPETSLHPKWQQQFPLIFKQVVEDIYGITDSHFIFCTHSPIIIHNAVQLGNSSVLKFVYKNNKFSSKVVKDVNKFCIEQLLLDDFGFEYLSQSELDVMANILNEYDAKKVVCDTPMLKSQIDDLYNQVIKQ